ncbi:MAG: hypothetical protein AB7I23_03025 [Vicinamibacterales bacterium]
MANTPQSADHDDLLFQQDIDEVFGRANPNPDRIGCPARDTLVAMARHRPPLGDPAYEHLASCSPCFLEFRALQAEATSVGTASRSGRRGWTYAALAAGVAFVAAVGWWFARDGSPPEAPRTAVTVPGRELRAEVDLRRFTTLRSEKPQEEAGPVSLPTGLVDLTLLLPVGAEPGTYDVQLLDSDLRSRSEATGEGAIENFVTTVRVRVNLQGLVPGRYQLAVRRHGDSWRMFDVQLQ